MSISTGLSAITSVACVLATFAWADHPTYFEGSTVKRWQLTGDWDGPRRMATLSRSGTRAGVYATDLGSSFEHRGRLYFLFGDTCCRPGARDVLAWTDSDDPDDLVLNFPIAGDGVFKPFEVPGVRLADFEVPVTGLSVAGRMYAVVTTDWDGANMTRSVLAVSDDDGGSWGALHTLSTEHFLNVALAHSPPYVYLWGSGAYRTSSPRLARVLADRLDDRQAIQYLSGLGPAWSSNEEDAVPLVDHPVIGELSAGWVETLGRWILLYNSSSPRGIVLRSAPEPWGPWSPPIVLFDPWNDMGYSKFMHVAWDFQQMDTFHDPGRENDWGGEYGPYFVGRFTEGDRDRATIYYTMSTWNPYQVVLMSSDIGYPERFQTESSRTTKTLPGDAGWATTGTFVPFLRDGIPHVTTFGAAGDLDLAVAHLGILMDADDGEISYTLHGGDGEVVLVEEDSPMTGGIADIPSFYDALKSGAHGRVVEAIAGPQTNEVDVPVRWNVRRHSGSNLRLYVIDYLTGPWSFVSVSQFAITKRDIATVLPPFRRGDCNDDGTVDISDPTTTLGVLFLGEGNYGCGDACDSNDDGAVDISDTITTLGMLFLGNALIPPPGRSECGVDPSDDALDCQTRPKSCQ